MDAETRWWTRLIAYIALAATGGILGYIMRSMDQNVRPSLARSLVEGLAAGFAGVILLFLCQALDVDDKMIGVIVGVGGWLGASATIRRLEPLAFGVTKNAIIHTKPSTDSGTSGSRTSSHPVGPSGTPERTDKNIEAKRRTTLGEYEDPGGVNNRTEEPP